MKKVLLTLITVGILSASGSAYAQSCLNNPSTYRNWSNGRQYSDSMELQQRQNWANSLQHSRSSQNAIDAARATTEMYRNSFDNSRRYQNNYYPR